MNQGFAVFKEPNSKTICFCKGDVKKLPKEWSVDSIGSGFLISPWSKADEIYIIQSELKMIDIDLMRIEIQSILNELNTTDKQSTSYQEFDEVVLSIQNLIIEGKVEKIVASRQKVDECSIGTEDLIFWFNQLVKLHENAFVSLVFTPDFGLWMGATPEILLHLDQTTLSTVSLAGTLYNVGDEWTEKERLEQSVTTKYIEGVLRKYGDSDTAKSEIEEIKSGTIKHLKSHFQVQINPYQVKNVLDDLSPTPAVGGYPKEEAVKWIQENEPYRRHLFSGFLGVVNVKSLHTYVNLRCVEISKNQQIFYAGCGINLGSVTEKEWLETEAKMGVTRDSRPPF